MRSEYAGVTNGLFATAFPEDTNEMMLFTAPQNNGKGVCVTLSMLNLGYGVDMVVDGEFNDATKWSGAGWVVADGKATHAAGNTDVLSPTPSLTFTEGTEYSVTFTVSGRGAGTITAKVAGATVTAHNENGTFTDRITAGASGNFELVPSSDFNGSLDSVEVTPVSTRTSVQVALLDSTEIVPALQNWKWHCPLFEGEPPVENTGIVLKDGQKIVVKVSAPTVAFQVMGAKV